MKNTTKRVHNVRVRVHDRSETLVREVLEVSLGAIPKEQCKITVTEDEGLWIGELWLDHQQPIRIYLRTILAQLTEHDKHTIATNPTKFLDIGTHCFLRFDKNALHEAKYILTSGSDVVSVRLNMASFPATREGAASTVTTLFSTPHV